MYQKLMDLVWHLLRSLMKECKSLMKQFLIQLSATKTALYLNALLGTADPSGHEILKSS